MVFQLLAGVPQIDIQIVESRKLKQKHYTLKMNIWLSTIIDAEILKEEAQHQEEWQLSRMFEPAWGREREEEERRNEDGDTLLNKGKISM